MAPPWQRPGYFLSAEGIRPVGRCCPFVKIVREGVAPWVAAKMSRPAGIAPRHVVEDRNLRPSHGSFRRMIPLAAEVDADEVAVDFKKGVLKGTLAKPVGAE